MENGGKPRLVVLWWKCGGSNPGLKNFSPIVYKLIWPRVDEAV